MIEPAHVPFIRMGHVSKTYPPTKQASGVQALQDTSLRVPRGSLVAIVGESGSGKTTLLNLLGGLDRPDSGTILVGGEDIGDLDSQGLTDYRAGKVGFVLQSYYLLPTLTAVENVELALEANRVPSRERRDRALGLLKLVGLTSRAQHRPGQLSGGEQQRVAIARALANRPVLLLADEPTGNLDRKNRWVVVDLLLRVARESGTTMIVVTHDARVSERCDLEYKLRDGTLRPTHRTSKRLAELESSSRLSGVASQRP